jgi:hypothetical protein
MTRDTTTTVEEDRHTATQRTINLVWETTQAIIALLVVGANVVAAFYLQSENTILGNAFFLVIGFYFGRTNHARAGGLPLPATPPSKT